MAKKGGRPVLDSQKVDEIVNLFEQGTSIRGIAKKTKVSRLTIRKYLKDRGYMDQEDEDEGPTDPDEADGAPSDDPDPTKAPDSVRASKDLIATYTGEGNENESELGKALRTIKRAKKDLRSAHRELANASRGAGTDDEDDEGDETSKGKDLLEARVEELKRIEEDAKKTLEKLGYKIVPQDEPTTEADAIDFLKSKGYAIESDKIDKKDLDKLLEKHKEEWDAAHNLTRESAIETQKLKALENIVVAGIDRVMAPFELVIAERLGLDPQEVLRAKTGGNPGPGPPSQKSPEERRAQARNVMDRFRQQGGAPVEGAEVVDLPPEPEPAKKDLSPDEEEDLTPGEEEEDLDEYDEVVASYPYPSDPKERKESERSTKSKRR